MIVNHCLTTLRLAGDKSRVPKINYNGFQLTWPQWNKRLLKWMHAKLSKGNHYSKYFNISDFDHFDTYNIFFEMELL